MSRLYQILDDFWTKHPALLYGCSALIGCYAVTSWNVWLLFPLCFLINLNRLVLTGLTCLLFTLYAHHFYVFPKEDIVHGKAELSISSLRYTTTHFGKRWLYKGTLKMDGLYLPYSLSLPDKEKLIRPPANQAYVIEGKLKSNNGNGYTFSVKNDTPWHPIAGSWSLAEMRYQLKNRLTQYLHRHISDQQAATFLSGIATGDFDDRIIMHEFSRFGLQHIMAISGFHFSIIAGILCLLIRHFFSKTVTIILMLGLLSFYFFFLGFGPSILRAWLTAVIALAGGLLQKQSSGLNSLGFAILAILIYDPWLCQNLGFQFSVLITASILVFYEPANQLCQKIISKKSLYQMLQRDIFDQHRYVILSLLREAIALGIAVNLMALPLTLLVFQKFPWLSLLYNLFFPFLVSISMFFLLMGMISYLVIPPLGELIHAVNSVYTQFTLDLTFKMPASFDFYFRLKTFPPEWIIVYITILGVIGIYLKHRLKEVRPQV